MQREAALSRLEEASRKAEVGDAKGALRDIDSVIAAGWVGSELALFKASLEHDLNRQGAAARSVALALGVDPGKAESFTLLAVIKMAAGDFRAAHRAVTEAKRLNPNHAYAFVVEAQLLAREAFVEETPALIESAMLRWANAVRLAPGDAGILCQYADFLLVHRRLRAAKAQAEAALALAPDWDVPHVVAAAVDLAAGRKDEARRHMTRAAEINPANPYLPVLKAQLDLPGGALLRLLFRWSDWILLDRSRVTVASLLPAIVIFPTFGKGWPVWRVVVVGLALAPIWLAMIGDWTRRFLARPRKTALRHPPA